jgi:general stress protein 26
MQTHRRAFFFSSTEDLTMDNSNPREKLYSLIKKYRFAMLTTNEGGALRSRPMTTIDRDFDGSLWFFAKADSATVTALGAHSGVCLSYSDSDNFDFVCVAGQASVVTDVAKKSELWKPAVQAWFPEGAESPLNVLIKVTPDHAEYWDSKSNKLTQLFSMAKALATGTPPNDMGEHQNVPLPAAGAR